MAGELGFETGPYVNVAAFVERVLVEKDDVLSAIRIIDQFSVQAEGPDVPDSLPGGLLQTTLLIVLKAGSARGSQKLQVVMEHPDGQRREGPEFAVNFSPGEGGGAGVVLPMAIQVDSAGLYWADIIVNSRLMARVPMMVSYGFTRQRAPGQ